MLKNKVKYKLDWYFLDDKNFLGLGIRSYSNWSASSLLLDEEVINWEENWLELRWEKKKEEEGVMKR